MALIVSPVSLEKGLKAIFLANITDQFTYADSVATTVPSDSNLETYGWMGQLPKVRQWIGEREIKGLESTKYNLTNLKWESTIGVLRDDIEDDKLGAYGIRIGQLAEVAGLHISELIASALVNGTDAVLGLCYDGGAFFTATHPARGQSGTQSNLQTGTGTTVAQLAADYEAVRLKMLRFLDESGRPWRRSLGKVIIACPPDLELTFRKVFNLSMISQTSNEVLQREDVEVLPMPELTDTNDWYALHVGSVLKPLILQMRVGIEFQAHERDAERAFMSDVWLYGTRGRYVVGYAFPWDAVKVTN